jgi:hypothetical protein
MLRREESRHDFAFIAGVIIGAVAGAVTTLALTPMSGNETREMIRSRVNEMDVDELKHKAADMKTKATESVAPAMEKVKTQVEDLAAKSPLPVGDDDQADEPATVTEMTPPATTERPATS